MTADSHRVQAVFRAAVVLTDPGERATFLDRECADNPALRKLVEDRLRGHDHLGRFLDPAVDSATVSPETRPIAPARPTVPPQSQGDVGGRYRLIQCVGEGGMGVVWRAEQWQPVRRDVAVKMIKPGMDSKAVLARFDAERQALALMDHPGIAKVLDGGTTEDGRPYFVMEFVKGIPVTEYCDGRQMTVADRLAVFTRVCEAVEHAHQKGIIHRDLKPTNVLVTEEAGQPVPKVIDFGLAKALGEDSPLGVRTQATALGAVLGTPLYMAPEQMGVNLLDVDTRADVYALGVILYELLTGTTPFGRERLRSAGWDEIRRMLREEDPPTPSARLSTLETLASVSTLRHEQPARLRRLLRGDLDWIVMKALEKDRNRRYATVGAFALDIQRCLANEPVAAGPPSRAYRVSKFLRRHRGGVLAGGIVALALAIGLVGSTWGLYRTEQARAGEAKLREEAEDARRREADRANAEAVAKREAILEREAAEKARKTAQAEAARANAVRKYLEEDVLGFDHPTPYSAEVIQFNNDLLYRDVLLRAAKRIDGRFPGDPYTEATLQTIIGNSLGHIGLVNDAIPHLDRALVLLESLFPPEDPRVLGVKRTLIDGLIVNPKNANRARKLAAELVVKLTALDGPTGKLTLFARVQQAKAMSRTDRPASVRELDECAKVFREVFAIDDDLRYLLAGRMARVYLEHSRGREAITLLTEAVDHWVKRDPNHPYVLSDQVMLADAALFADDHRQAIAALEQVVPKMVTRFTPKNNWVIRGRELLAAAYTAAGKHREAVKELEERLARIRELNGQSMSDKELECARDLVWALADDGQHEKAVKTAVGYVVKLREWRSPLPGELAGMLLAQGRALTAAGKVDQAEPLLRESLRIREQSATMPWLLASTRSQLGQALVPLEKHDEAEKLLRDAIELLQKVPGTGMHPHIPRKRLREAYTALVSLYESTGRTQDAAKWREELAKLTSGASK